MKKYKPTTKSRRSLQTIDYRKLLSGDTKEKKLTGGFQRAMGRNNMGRVTSQHRGGGNKRLYRAVDFLYNKIDIPAKITTIEYDPNRSAFIGVAVYADGEKRYVIVPKSVKVGDKFIVGKNAPIEPGNRLALKDIPVGTFIYNIELKPNSGARIVRSAGTFAQLIALNEGFAQVKLPSTEVRRVDENCFACVGEISNDEHKLRNFGKAGRSRWRGIRPKVRGTAMNPVDHPYGGGEGVQGRGTKRPKTRHGKVTGGHKTRTPKKYSNPHIVTRRKVGKR